MDKQPDIFDRNSVWLTEPLVAFGAFIRSEAFVELGRYATLRRNAGKPVRPLKESSAEIYVHMFSNYLRWLTAHRLQLQEATPGDIMTFLNARHTDKRGRVSELHSLIRVRYLRLLERVYAHCNVTPNPARDAAFNIYRTSATGADKPKAFLNQSGQMTFLEELAAAPAFDETNPDAPTWKRRRDRALLAMMLGAGLRVSEVLALRTDQLGGQERDGSIPIKIPDHAAGGDGHKTVLRPFAARHVLPWIEERKKREIPSKLLFPTSLKTGAPLNKATVYRHVKATLERAGIEVERMGGRTLRNSFAVRELENGAPVELVKQYMGHHELRSTEKYLQPKARQRRLEFDMESSRPSAEKKNT
jgi:site-specific recombinase XerD